MKPSIIRSRHRPAAAHLPGLLAAAVTGLFLLQSAAIAGSAHQSVKDIRQQVQQFIDSHDFDSALPVVSSVGKVDSRLRLQRCAEPLEIHFANDNFRGGRTFLSVACTTGKPWSIYVTAKIDLFAQVLVSTKPLLRGQTVGSGDIILATRMLSTLRTGYFTDLKQLEGMQVTRTIGVGKVISALLVRARYLVTRGQQVTLIATTGNISIRMKGKALANATLNSRVKVKNTSSGRIVEGVVINEGIVKIFI